MKHTKLLILILFLQFGVFAQNTISKSKFPSHGVEEQKKAIPFYNKACVAYNKGDTSLAIKELHRAINTSLALTEAQLFLADIYYETKNYEKALTYYNSGIDFETNQNEHYYFYLFELGMRFGVYDVIKHNLKHFKKIYGEDYHKQYEEDYPFGTVDYEYYKSSIDMIYNYKSWKTQYLSTPTKTPFKVKNIGSFNNKFVVQTNNLFYGKYVNRKEKTLTKRKILNLKADAKNVFISHNKKYAFYELSINGNSDIYYSEIKGKKLQNPIRLNDSINTKHYEGQVYFSKNGNYIYLVSNRTGNNDIYLAKINLKTNKTEFVKNMDKINTPRDEQYPVMNEDETKLFFSSNGYAGYGGFDLFETTAYEKYGELLIPLDPINLKCNLNSNDNELKIAFTNEKTFVLRQDINNKNTIIYVEKANTKPDLDIDIKTTPTED